MSTVDTTIWPDADAIPTGYVNPGGQSGPFGVLRLLGGSGCGIQFMDRVTPAEQAKYLRALAKVATELADELDPTGGGAA